ncbi:MAG: hypothetical protein K2N15_08980 [Lachnospiraceae bacterium]|nr:hypothetical protein [Lachnospiraceae bacterium]
MRIILKSLHIENFKGIKLLDVVFGAKTKIKGQNASGKTTIFDSFTWLLFNKNSAGEEKFNIRPLDEKGNRVDNVEIKVVAVLEVDGKEVELSKVQRQNWVKHRGSTAPKLGGNVNSFAIDGYPKSEVDYKAYISSLVPESLFKMLTNPQYFSNMKWKEQRDILMKFVSDIPDVELAQNNPEFADLLPELEKAPSTDDIQKKFSKALSEWKKKQQEIPVRIDELSKSLVQIDIAEKELAKVDLERRITEIDTKIADAGSAVADLRSEEMKLQFDMSGIMQTMNRELTDKRRELENAKDEERIAFSDCHSKIFAMEKQIEDNKASIEAAEKKRSELGEQYKAEVAKAFDETPYLFHEEEWQFDENSTICKSCGQTLPADKIEQIKADFEEKKAKAKADAEKRLVDAKNRFVVQHNSDLEEIKAYGFRQKDIIDKLTDANITLQAEIESLKKQEQEALAKQNELTKQLDEFPAEADYSQNAEYTKLKARHDEVVADIAKTDFLGRDELTEQFKEEKAELQAELDAVNAEIAKASRNVEIEDRISELEAEQKEVSQKVADQENMLYMLETFIRAKMLKISNSINQHFKTVKFKLFEIQLNGGVKECCECMVNGIPYSTLNSGHRIVAGLDIIQSLSELYGVTAPIFIDNAESLNDSNVPDMETQMILLAVSDDKKLKVEVE